VGRRGAALLVLASTALAGAGEGASRDAGAMATLPAGRYRAVTSRPDEPARAVPAFRLDRYPVTNLDYLAFVRANPAWRRDRAPRAEVDDQYLAQWNTPTELGPDAPPRAPVVGVSWFAARAYCASHDARLPSEAEWETAASAGATTTDDGRAAGPSSGARQEILAWYMRPNPARLPDVGQRPPNAWGIYDLHGLVWEWVSDFSASMLVGDSARLCGAGANGARDPLDYPAFLRVAFRSALEGRMTTRNLGFRCARNDEPPPPAPAAGSLYDLGLRVVGPDGTRKPLDDLRGHPVLASMFFASCPSACPLLIQQLKSALAANAPAAMRDDVRILLVSFDPARDTPAVLREVLHRHDLNPRRWRIATAADQDEARLLAAVLGVRYREAAGGLYDHTTRVTVIDADGRVRGRADDAAHAAAMLAPAARP
jgi:formylglycine-generating enzyme required for sulfatase activity/cytochrome oxidase Cu insertion factor (SCO1/SenC/PrrC family)